MHYHDYREDRREGRVIYYAREREGCGECPDEICREKIERRVEYFMEKDYHFHKFKIVETDDRQSTLRRDIEGCADCPFELSLLYGGVVGEPVRVTLMSQAADRVDAIKAIEERRAAIVASAFGRSAAACA